VKVRQRSKKRYLNNHRSQCETMNITAKIPFKKKKKLGPERSTNFSSQQYYRSTQALPMHLQMKHEVHCHVNFLLQVHNAYSASVRIFLPYLSVIFLQLKYFKDLWNTYSFVEPSQNELLGPPRGLTEDQPERNTDIVPCIAQPVFSWVFPGKTKHINFSSYQSVFQE